MKIKVFSSFVLCLLALVLSPVSRAQAHPVGYSVWINPLPGVAVGINNLNPYIYMGGLGFGGFYGGYAYSTFSRSDGSDNLGRYEQQIPTYPQSSIPELASEGEMKRQAWEASRLPQTEDDNSQIIIKKHPFAYPSKLGIPQPKIIIKNGEIFSTLN